MCECVGVTTGYLECACVNESNINEYNEKMDQKHQKSRIVDVYAV